MQMNGKLPEHLLNPDVNIYKRNDYVTIDFETTNLLKGSALSEENRIVLTAWDISDSISHSWANEFNLDHVVNTCTDAGFLVAHNAKFELQWLVRCGLDLHDVVVWDTMVAEHVLGGNRYFPNQLSLDAICKRRGMGGKLGVVSKWIKDGVCPSEIPRSLLLKYCLLDVALTKELFRRQLKEACALNLLAVIYTRCLMTPVLADIESNGLDLDVTRVTPLYEEKRNDYVELGERLDAVTGGINLNSNKQLGGYIYDRLAIPEATRYGKPIRTPTGLRKTDTGTIGLLSGRNKSQREFLALYNQYSSVSSELSKYLRTFERCCVENGGHLRARFHQCNTRTHRLSSTGFDFPLQFHNQPRNYKRLYVADGKGRLVGETDGSQLEFRVAVHLGRDSIGLGDIVSGRDVHNASASIIGVSRQDAKEHTFKPLYGGSSGSAKEREYYRYFKERYRGIADAQQGWIDDVLCSKDNRLVTEYGMIYYYPGTRITKSGYVTNTTTICNYPVQGFATAEIIPIALVYFWHLVRDTSIKLVNTVHDSAVSTFDEESVGEYREYSRVSFIDCVYEYLYRVYGVSFTVPLGCGIKTAPHWGDTKKELKYEAREEFWK